MVAASKEDLPEVLGAYRVVRRLATGGTSDVLLARAEGPYGFERAVVLKVLLRELRDDDRFGKMFVREAAAYSRLTHPAIVRLYDFFADTGGLVLVLEYVDGLPLHRLLALLHRAERFLPDDAAYFVGWRIFSGLAAAHTAVEPATGTPAPVIHGDVNPSNVLIPWDGHVKIADFGMAKVTGIDGGTHAGLMKGTFGYSAPEQVRGDAVTVRADVYAGCVMLWELLAHRKAVARGARPAAEIGKTTEPSFPPLGALRPDLPRKVLEALDRGLEPDASRRTLAAAEIAALLQEIVSLQGARKALVDCLEVARRPVLDSVDEEEDGDITVRISEPSAQALVAMSAEKPERRGAPVAAPAPPRSPAPALPPAPVVPARPMAPAGAPVVPRPSGARAAVARPTAAPAAPRVCV